MDTNIKPVEGEASPTPPADMSTTSQTPAADQPQATPVAEAKSSEILFAEEALGRTFASKEDALKALQNLNSMVGDQTLAKQRKAIEKISQQANLSPEELFEVLETQTQSVSEPIEEPPAQIQVTQAPDAYKRLTRLEVDEVVKNDPDAGVIRDTLFAESLATGRSAGEIWKAKYKPIVEIGKKAGVEKLQQTKESQPMKGTSTASDTDIKLDARKLSLEELEKLTPKGRGYNGS